MSLSNFITSIDNFLWFALNIEVRENMAAHVRFHNDTHMCVDKKSKNFIPCGAINT